MLQKLNALLQRGILQDHQLLRQLLQERQEAPLRVEPGVGAELLVVRFQALHHSRDAELVIALGAVQRPDHQIHDAQVKELLVLILERHRLLLLLDLLHQLLGLRVLRGHDVADAEIREDYGAHVQDLRTDCDKRTRGKKKRTRERRASISY